MVIAKEIRDRLAIQPDWLALQRVVDDHVEMYFLPPEQNRSLAGVLARYTSVRIPDDDELERAIERSWEHPGDDEEWHERGR